MILKAPNKAMLHRCYAAGLANARRKSRRYKSLVSSVRLFYILLLVSFLGACGIAGEYYVLQERDGEVHRESLYDDEDLWIEIEFFTGHVSRLDFQKNDQAKNLDFEILRIQHAVSINGISAQFESAQGYDPNILDLTESPLYISEKRYKLEIQPKTVVESINMSLLINGVKVEISKDFPLRRVTYNHFQALQGI